MLILIMLCLYSFLIQTQAQHLLAEKRKIESSEKKLLLVATHVESLVVDTNLTLLLILSHSNSSQASLS